jgi:hypothetical protein
MYDSFQVGENNDRRYSYELPNGGITTRYPSHIWQSSSEVPSYLWLSDNLSKEDTQTLTFSRPFKEDDLELLSSIPSTTLTSGLNALPTSSKIDEPPVNGRVGSPRRTMTNLNYNDINVGKSTADPNVFSSRPSRLLNKRGKQELQEGRLFDLNSARNINLTDDLYTSRKSRSPESLKIDSSRFDKEKRYNWSTDSINQTMVDPLTRNFSGNREIMFPSWRTSTPHKVSSNHSKHEDLSSNVITSMNSRYNPTKAMLQKKFDSTSPYRRNDPAMLPEENYNLPSPYRMNDPAMLPEEKYNLPSPYRRNDPAMSPERHTLSSPHRNNSRVTMSPERYKSRSPSVRNITKEAERYKLTRPSVRDTRKSTLPKRYTLPSSSFGNTIEAMLPERYKSRSHSFRRNTTELMPSERYKSSCPSFTNTTESMSPERYKSSSPSFRNAPESMSPERYKSRSPSFRNIPKSMSPERYKSRSPSFRNTPKSMSPERYKSRSPSFRNTPESMPPERYKSRSPSFRRNTLESMSPERYKSTSPSFRNTRESVSPERYKSTSLPFRRKTTDSMLPERYTSPRFSIGNTAEPMSPERYPLPSSYRGNTEPMYLQSRLTSGHQKIGSPLDKSINQTYDNKTSRPISFRDNETFFSPKRDTNMRNEQLYQLPTESYYNKQFVTNNMNGFGVSEISKIDKTPMIPEALLKQRF